jgi:hypothetical protein
MHVIRTNSSAAASAPCAAERGARRSLEPARRAARRGTWDALMYWLGAVSVRGMSNPFDIPRPRGHESWMRVQTLVPWPSSVFFSTIVLKKAQVCKSATAAFCAARTRHALQEVAQVLATPTRYKRSAAGGGAAACRPATAFSGKTSEPSPKPCSAGPSPLWPTAAPGCASACGCCGCGGVPEAAALDDGRPGVGGRGCTWGAGTAAAVGGAALATVAGRPCALGRGPAAHVHEGRRVRA